LVDFSTVKGRKELKLGYKVSNIKSIQQFGLYVIKGTAPTVTSSLFAL
jgi:hypothetical protein